MPYIRLADLYSQFGEEEIRQIADTDNTGTIDPVLVRRAIDNADAEINVALAVRYPLPLPRVPQIIKRLSGDLARWFLYGMKIPEAVEDRAKLARDMLKQLASGELALEGMEPQRASHARIHKGRRRMKWSGKEGV